MKGAREYPRYVEVPLPDGQRLAVRVLTYHKDDAKLQGALYECDALNKWCSETDAKLPTLTGGDLVNTIKTLTEVRLKRDDAMRELFKLALGDKLSGEQVESAFRQMDAGAAGDVLYAFRNGSSPYEDTLAAQLKVITAQWTPEQIKALVDFFARHVTGLPELLQASAKARRGAATPSEST